MGSNHGPHEYQSSALPAELHAHLYYQLVTDIFLVKNSATPPRAGRTPALRLGPLPKLTTRAFCYQENISKNSYFHNLNFFCKNSGSVYNSRIMMIGQKNIFFLSIFILATQYLFGLPTFWKSLLITFTALIMLFLSLKISLPRKIIKNKLKKEKLTSSVENFTPANVYIPAQEPEVLLETSQEVNMQVVDIKPKPRRRTSPKKPPIV